jgi:hypothetical protein
MGATMLRETQPRAGRPAGADEDREIAIRKITHLAEVEKSFDEMCSDLAVATKEVSRLTDIARDAVTRLDTSLRGFRQSVERMKAVDPAVANEQLAVIEGNIAAFETELANLSMRFGRFQPSLDQTQAAIEKMIRSVVSDAEEEIEAEVRWMKHSLRKKMSEQSLYTNKHIELSTQRVTQKVSESRDYLRNLLYVVLFLVVGSIGAQIYFAFVG